MTCRSPRHRSSNFAGIPLIVACLIALPDAGYSQSAEILVVDEENGWPIPMVELRTTSQAVLITDNAGRVAFDLKEFLGKPTWLSIESHGYEVPKDRFGFRGVRVTPQPGKKLTIKMKRQFAARRIGRLTGSGLFSESQQLGKALDWSEQGIVGCDTVRVANYDGKLFWVWGDTNLANYPLGIFHTLGATTPKIESAPAKPPLRFRFDYVSDQNRNRPKGICRMPGDGPTWLGGLVSIQDKNGKARLVGHYTKVRKFLEVYESGLCVWDDDAKQFEKETVLWRKDSGEPMPVVPDGHVNRWKDKTGREWLLFGDLFPILKIPANFEAWKDRTAWEELKPIKKLTLSGKHNGKQSISVHRGSIAWNEHRKKWVTIFGQHLGAHSMLGDIWYADSDTPFGPWNNLQLVFAHQNYSFYNPRVCSEMLQESDKFLLFEGTYTKTFSKTSTPTPKYNYNQMLYRVDFADLDFANESDD